MSTINDQIRLALMAGKSLRKTAREIGISYPSVRRRAIETGLFQPKYKGVTNGKAKCLGCGRILPIEQFPRIAEAKYKCSDCLRMYMHKFQLRKTGCSEDMYKKMFEAQGGRCAICGAKEGHKSKSGVSCKLAVDHCHETGKIRGLLCGRCNRGLGYLREENLSSALEYVKGAG